MEPQEKGKEGSSPRTTLVVEREVMCFTGIMLTIASLGAAAAQVNTAWREWRTAPRAFAVELDDGRTLRGPAAVQHFKRSAVIHAVLALVMLAAASIGAAIAVRNGRQLARLKRGCCVRCGYDLTGNVSGVCPECGNPVAKREP